MIRGCGRQPMKSREGPLRLRGGAIGRGWCQAFWKKVWQKPKTISKLSVFLPRSDNFFLPSFFLKSLSRRWLKRIRFLWESGAPLMPGLRRRMPSGSRPERSRERLSSPRLPSVNGLAYPKSQELQSSDVSRFELFGYN